MPDDLPPSHRSPESAENSPAQSVMSERRRAAYIALGLVAAVFCAYALIFGADFIDYDDNSHVFRNAGVIGGLSWQGIGQAFTQFHASLWLPLTWISFMTDISLFGLNPGAMHMVNVGWHAASTVLLFYTLRKMTGKFWESAFVAALFGLHPINVESVGWITERKNVLCAFFWIACLGAYTRYVERPAVWRYGLALLAAALALLAKPMAVTLPCTLLLLDVWPLRRPANVPWWRLVVEKVPFFALVGLTAWLTIHAQRAPVASLEAVTLSSRVSNALVSYVVYLGDFVWPLKLGIFYPHPIDPQPGLAGAALALLLTVTALAGWMWKRHPYFLIGWFWFLGTLVPTIGLVQAGSQARADRFTYVSQIGLFVAVVWLVRAQWPRSVRIQALLGSAILLGCGLLTFRQAGYWVDGATLFEHTIAVTKDNACAYANAGLHRAREGNLDKAIQHFQASLRIQADQAVIWKEMGAALLKTGRPAPAVVALQTSLQYDEKDITARYQLGVALQESGAAEEAIATFERLLIDTPRSSGSHYHLALALRAKGREAEAVAHLQEAARLAPEDARILAALGKQ